MHRITCLAAAALAACAHGRAADAEAERRALLDADAAFARATAERGVEGWVSFFAEDGEMFPNRSPPVRGHAGIRELMADLGDPRKGPTALRLSWQPARAVVSASGDLGSRSEARWR